MNTDHHINWHKTSNTQWQTTPHRTYTGTIDRIGASAPYTHRLTVTPGPVVTTVKTLGQAKNEFRKFLLDKPVDI